MLGGRGFPLSRDLPGVSRTASLHSPSQAGTLLRPRVWRERARGVRDVLGSLSPTPESPSLGASASNPCLRPLPSRRGSLLAPPPSSP